MLAFLLCFGLLSVLPFRPKPHFVDYTHRVGLSICRADGLYLGRVTRVWFDKRWGWKYELLARKSGSSPEQSFIPGTEVEVFVSGKRLRDYTLMHVMASNTKLCGAR